MATRGKKKMTTIYLDEEMHAKLKEYAHQHYTTISTVINQFADGLELDK